MCISQIYLLIPGVDQALEQEIKKLKGVGGIKGLTQNDVGLDRFFLIAPELSQIVEKFEQKLDIDKHAHQLGHYQSSSNQAKKLQGNAWLIKEKLVEHCERNPFVLTDEKDLANFCTNRVILETVKYDILERDVRGQRQYEDFVSTRLCQSTATLSVWSPISKIKLKTFSTTSVKLNADKKVAKENSSDRQLLNKILIIQRERPSVREELPEIIGNYELTEVPKSLFNTHGELFIPQDKSSFMKGIEDLHLNSGEVSTVAQTPLHTIRPLRSIENLQESTERAGEVLLSDVRTVCIIDAMAVVQSMKKTPDMRTCRDLSQAFVHLIDRTLIGYTEGRVVFDTYRSDSLKQKARQYRRRSSEV